MNTSKESDITSNDGVNYEDSLSYWEGIPPTVDGMLGGFGFISSVDIQGSEQFLKTMFQVRLQVIKQVTRLMRYSSHCIYHQ